MKKIISNSRISLIKSSFFKMGMLLLLLTFSLTTKQAVAVTEPLAVSGGGSVTAPNVAVNIAGNAIVTYSSNLTGATASIVANFVTGQDVLGISGSTSGTDGSITYSYSAATGVLTLIGSTTAANYQTTIRKITYTNTSTTPTITARTVTISLNSALPYSDNGHYYEFKASAGIFWSDAQTAAATLTYFGLQGYLATVTSSGENDFCKSKLVGQGWIGASDAALEGTWKWVTGPENGNTFYSGGSCNTYCNWHSGEPNNAGTENYAHFWTDGTWNDLANSNTSCAGYVVEFGGSTGDPTPTISANVTVDFLAPAAPTGVTGYSTICNGHTTTLTANGAVGTVYWYTGSCGGTQVGTGTPFTTGALTTGTTYWARNYWGQFSTACAPASGFAVTVTPVPTLAILEPIGDHIKWYNVSGTLLPKTTVLIDGTVYYASQTVNGCESTARLAVTATVGTH